MDAEYYDQVIVHNFQAKFIFFKWITNCIISSYIYSYEKMPCKKPGRETKSHFLVQKATQERMALSTMYRSVAVNHVLLFSPSKMISN